MKKMFKRVLSLLIATATCLSMGLSAFASEATTSSAVNDSFATTDDSGIMPRGTISGYAYAVITPAKNYIIIPCSSSVNKNETSGMGITIQTKCSQKELIVGYSGYAEDYKASTINGSMKSEDEVYLGGSQWGCNSYRINFTIPAGCPSFEVRVWIYG